MPQPCPHLAVPFAWEGRCLQDTPDMGHQLVIHAGATGPLSGAKRRALVPLPVDGGACHTPHAADRARPYGLPVERSTDPGPVEPWQPPMLFTPITKKRSVSIGLPGPMRLSHQPIFLGSSA